jgi:hypothetical protein
MTRELSACLQGLTGSCQTPSLVPERLADLQRCEHIDCAQGRRLIGQAHSQQVVEIILQGGCCDVCGWRPESARKTQQKVETSMGFHRLNPSVQHRVS